MSERSQVLLTALLGAVAGGLFGCLYLTERGRSVRGQFEPMLDSVIKDLQQVRRALDKTRTAVAEGHRVTDDVLHEAPTESSWESRDFGRVSS